MKTLFKILKYTGLTLLVVIPLLLGYIYWHYGGGSNYPDLTSSPLLNEKDVELFFSYPEPIGNVAVTRDTNYQTRVFFTVHPESRPEGNKVLEIVAGKAIPYPDAASQKTLFNTVLGVYVDNQNRLWTIDHGNHATQDVKLLAFDLKTNKVAHEHIFPSHVAEWLSFFNDLTVSPDGKYVFVADVSFWRKSPSIAVYDVEKKESRSLLDNHASVSAQNWVPKNPTKEMRFFGGLACLKAGIDGIDCDTEGKYVYYASMAHEGLYRIPIKTLTDKQLSASEVAKQVEFIAKKPLSDGIRLDKAGNVYITDIDHQGVSVVTPQKELKTLIKDKRIRWADGLSFAGDGWCYLADSAIPDQMLMSKAHMKAKAPYHIFRFKSPL
jgi:sugar lactone lactonase YvrE